MMKGDKKTGDQPKKKEEGVSKGRAAADLVADKGMRKKEEEDNGGPAMRTRARKRSREEAGLCHDSLAGDLEMGRKSSRGIQRRKKQHEETPAQDVLPSASSSGGEQGVPDMVSRCPDLVQDKIFEKLSLRDKGRVAQVCSSWRDAVYRPSHWRGLTPKVEKPKQVVCSLMKRQINSICLSAPCTELKEVLVKFNSLESLTLSSRNSAILLKSLSVERFVSLKKLILTIGNKRQMDLLKACLICFPNLVHLEITGFVTTCLLEAIVDEMKSLESLYLCKDGNCPEELNVEALGQLKRLQGLTVEGFQLQFFKSLSQVSSTLQTLCLWNCDIQGGEWTSVLSQLRSLTCLTIVGCWPVLDSVGLRLLAQALPNLTSFACGGDSTTRFAISDLDRLNDEHLSAVAEMSGLQEVRLCYDSCITDSGVVALCTRLSTLSVLDICECKQITSKGIECISNLSSLTELVLEHGRDGEKWLEILAKGSCKLRKLDLFYFETSDEGMQHLAHMSTLRFLDLRKVSIGEAGMAHLSKATFHLESLEVCYCGITVEGLIPLLERQTSLRRLILVEEKRTPRSKVLFLKGILPHLEKCSVFHWKPKKFSWNALLSKLN